jgi:glycosyltransferase involved in cell wall biosynthesis
MKIFHIIIGLNVGGAEMMLKRLIESQLANTSHDQTVISLTDMGALGAELRAMGVSVHSLGMRSAVHIPHVFYRLVSLIRAARPDIVQTWMYHADLLGGLAARFVGIRHVIWGVRTTDIRAGGSFTTLIIRWLCARLASYVPSRIVCVAEASRRVHVEIGYDAKKMVVVPNGYDFSKFKVSPDERNHLREEFGILWKDMVVGSIGRFDAVKDHKTFVRAAGLLVAQYPALRFLMIGRGLDWDNIQLVDWIAQTGCREHFILLGERKDIPQCLATMDVYCLHSRTEGFPNVLAEAMAMGLPCVTTNVGDAAILLGETGVVVSQGTSQLLAQGLTQLLDLSKQELHMLGVKARARVEAEYSIDKARHRFEDVYRQVLLEGVS